MLPVLMGPELGGNWVTDHIGQWMRAHGLAAMIYPSARDPAGVIWCENTVQLFPGWNLVDYHGLQAQFARALTMAFGSDSWTSEYADHFKLEEREGLWAMSPPGIRGKALNWGNM